MPARAHLSNGGVDLLVEDVEGALVIRYWGPSLNGEPNQENYARAIPNSDFDEMQNPGVMREQSRGWLGAPTISGHRNGKDWSTRFDLVTMESTRESLSARMRDELANLELIAKFTLDKFGVLLISYELVNLGEDYCLNELRYWLPLSDRATETLDFAGRWSNERNPQRKSIAIGEWIRESREGRSGHNFTIGQIALCSNTNFGNGQAWSVALAWSGDSRYSVEKNYEGSQAISAAEILYPGEMILKSGDSYRAPDLIATFSNGGLDGLAQAHHAHIRARKNHPTRPRPLTLNMWEAVYFDHSDDRVRRLVDIAAEIGVERVVLDDGWFGSRRSDRSGLGDWQVSPEVWPNGLSGISKYVASNGMEFGLWFEGEMVNPDSDLYRAHPEWILSEAGRIPATWRHELVLNLANPDAYRYVLESVSKVIAEAEVKYIKWDHNRTLVEAGYLGRAAVHRQTQAIYQLFDELKRLHPGLEIESCASGGARIDLGMIDHVDRFWTSDNNDALERQRIQRWTAQFIPPELLGTHVGSTPSHQTGRHLTLPFRTLTALFGHAGIEWDITKISDQDKAALQRWIVLYKNKRALIHSGKMIREDYPDPDHYLYGVVSDDKKEALYGYVQLHPITSSQPPKLRFNNLATDKNYRVRVLSPAGEAGMMLIKPPNWLTSEFTATGSVLSEVGLPAPILRPAEGILIEFTAN